MDANIWIENIRSGDTSQMKYQMISVFQKMSANISINFNPILWIIYNRKLVNLSIFNLNSFNVKNCQLNHLRITQFILCLTWHSHTQNFPGCCVERVMLLHGTKVPGPWNRDSSHFIVIFQCSNFSTEI